MKLGPIEGTKEEITGFFQDNGLKASDYFQMPEPPLRSAWLVPPTICIVFAIGALTLLGSLSSGQQKFAFLLGSFASVWLATVIQLRYKQAWATSMVVILCLLLMLVAFDAVSPTEMLGAVKSLWK